MTRKLFCCALLVVILTVAAAKPARAVDAQGVLIIIAATAFAAASDRAS